MSETLGLAELVTALRTDLIESQRQLHQRQDEARRDPDVIAYLAAKREIEAQRDVARQMSYKNPLDEQVRIEVDECRAALEALVMPPAASVLEAPLKLRDIEVELSVSVTKSASGGLSLSIINAGTDIDRATTHRVKLMLGTDYEHFDIGG